MTREQLETLRRALPPFPVPAKDVPGLVAFCEFYRLDFVSRYPDLEHSAGTITSGPHRLATN